jgi:hypothetical protein
MTFASLAVTIGLLLNVKHVSISDDAIYIRAHLTCSIVNNGDKVSAALIFFAFTCVRGHGMGCALRCDSLCLRTCMCIYV